MQKFHVTSWQPGTMLSMHAKPKPCFDNARTFYIIKPTCILWLVFKGSNYFKKLSKSSNPKLCLHCRVMTSAQGGIETSSLFVLENGVKFNICDVVSAV